MPVPDFSPGEVLTAAAMDSIGLWLVKSQTIGTGVTSVTVTDAFSADYDNYRILVGGMVGSNNNVFQMRMEGATGANYDTQMIYSSLSSGSVNGAGTVNGTFWNYMGSVGTNNCVMDMNLFSPFRSQFTFVSTNFWDAAAGTGTTQGSHKLSTSYTGFTIFPSLGTLTGGTIRVYGYRN